MSSKKPKSTVSSAGSKGKGKKPEAPPCVESLTGPGHPEDISPLVLTSATQELFGCRADEDLTGERPYKLLRKDDIVQDMKTRAAVSDFSPVKQIVLDYPEDEILLVFDRDFTYGQSFYLVLTPEAKERILNPPQPQESETSEVSELEVCKTPEPKPWISLGSEQEIEEESVRESREKLKFKVSRVRRKFGAPVCFSDRHADDDFTECLPYQDSRFSIKQMQRDCGIQAVPMLQNSSAQTQWKHKKNMWTQYESRELSEEEKEIILQSESLKNFMRSVTPRVLQCLQQNEIMDVFIDDWGALGTGDRDNSNEETAGTGLCTYENFTHEQYCKDKTISSISWHPTINGVIAAAMTEKVSFEERFDLWKKFELNPPLILLWRLSNPHKPQLLLECPDDVSAFEFCPSDPNIIVGGCMNGQLVLWDISRYVHCLQESWPCGGKNIFVNIEPFGIIKVKVKGALRQHLLLAYQINEEEFEEKKEKKIPMLRYCATSGIEGTPKSIITDVQWLPQTFEVTKTGAPVENKNKRCVQLVTCSPDWSLMFWDIRVPVKMNVEKPKSYFFPERLQHLRKVYGVPDTFRHLDRTWKPLFRVSLPMIDTDREYRPLKFSFEDHICDSHTGSNTAQMHEVGSKVTLDYSQLRQSLDGTLKSLDDVNTKLFIGTEDGDIVYTDWKLQTDESEQLHSAKPTCCLNTLDWLVNTVQRSPFFKDIILTVGGWDFAILKEGVMEGHIFQSPSSEPLYTAGCWSPTRPAVLFVGKNNGNIEVWNLLKSTHQPSHVHNASSAMITCIKPWIFSPKQHFLAVSDDLGVLQILEIPRTFCSPSANEEQRVKKYFDREADVRVYFTKRMEVWDQKKKNMEAEALKKKVEPEKTQEQIDEEDRKLYEEYLALEKSVLTKLGLLPASDNMQDV